MTDDGTKTRQRSPDEPCRNCGNETPGAYCPACGQRKVDVRVSVRALLADVLEDQLVLNRALPRTIGALLFRPGLLTREYVRGRIVRYIAPFRLYLVASVVFFLIVSFVGLQALEGVHIGAPALSQNADSTRQLLRDRFRNLAESDTTEMEEATRAVVREAIAGVGSALAAIDDTATVLDSAQLADLTRRAEGRVALAPGAQQPWARNIRLDASSGWLERAMKRKLAQISHLPPQEAVRALAGDLLEYAPHMVFLLLPFFALLLKLLYIRRDRYYAEHFVFALHVHAFVFVMMTLMFLLPWSTLDGILLLWVALYIWLAMRTVYAQGWLRTTLKWWTLGWLYFFVFTFGVAGLAFFALLLT